MAVGWLDEFLNLTLIGVGAMNSPRYRPAGLRLAWHDWELLFDGSAGAAQDAPDAWLVCDLRAELSADIRRAARARGLEPSACDWEADDCRVRALPVVHTTHPTWGYLIEVPGWKVVWAPEFWLFPRWAAGADLMFADAAGWQRPIRFAGGAGGHASVVDTCRQARRHRVGRLVFAHIGRPCVRAHDAGLAPPWGEWGIEERTYRLPAPR
jgi:hypothetical protein